MAGAFHIPVADEPSTDKLLPGQLPDRDERREKYMQKTRAEASYLFKYLILTQIVIYLEAGAIPCLLDQLSVDLNMNATQQGALGGIVYLSLSAASPLCAYMLQRFNPQHVLGVSLILNNLATGVLAIIPTGYAFSANLMIFARALIGFTQAFPCIYTPLWVDEYAPREKVAGWMSYLQGSVPMGVMLGYFAGTVSNWFVPESWKLFQTWRWPFVVQFVLMCPIMVAVFFVPRKHLVIRNEGDKSPVASVGSNSSGGSSSIGSSEGNGSIETVEEILAAAAEAAAAETFDDTESDIAAESMPLLNIGTTPASADKQRLKRSSRTTSGGDVTNRSFIGYLEDAIKLGTNPPLSWSGPNHEEEDVLLASASMFGGTSQRGIRQLHHNQQHQQLGNETPGTLRRSFPSFLSNTTEGSPALQRTPSEMSGALAAAASGPPSTADNGVSSMSVTRVASLPTRSTSGYGAFDAVAHSPIKSPSMSYLEASIMEDEFYEVYEQGSFSEGLKELMRIPIFCFIVCGLTAVYFVVTGVQYWSTIFMIKSLHASKYLVNGLFVLVAGTGPIFGVFYGGWLIDRYGGYIGVEQRAKSLGICMILGVIAFIISAATTFFDDIYTTAAFLWLLLFFGGSILPACTGIFISVVPAQHRALASSFSVMVFNLIGYSLSPYLTGLVMEWVLSQYGKPDTYFAYCDEACAYRVGFRFCLFWSVWSFVCIGAAYLFARKEANAKAKEELDFYASLKPYAVEQA